MTPQQGLLLPMNMRTPRMAPCALCINIAILLDTWYPSSLLRCLLRILFTTRLWFFFLSPCHFFLGTYTPRFCLYAWLRLPTRPSLIICHIRILCDIIFLCVLLLFSSFIHSVWHYLSLCAPLISFFSVLCAMVSFSVCSSYFLHLCTLCDINFLCVLLLFPSFLYSMRYYLSLCAPLFFLWCSLSPSSIFFLSSWVIILFYFLFLFVRPQLYNDWYDLLLLLLHECGRTHSC